jgi:hypothetical protein
VHTQCEIEHGYKDLTELLAQEESAGFQYFCHGCRNHRKGGCPSKLEFKGKSALNLEQENECDSEHNFDHDEVMIPAQNESMEQEEQEQSTEISQITPPLN